MKLHWQFCKLQHGVQQVPSSTKPPQRRAATAARSPLAAVEEAPDSPAAAAAHASPAEAPAASPVQQKRRQRSGVAEPAPSAEHKENRPTSADTAAAAKAGKV